MIFRGKILLLYKNYKNKYEGWVLPKGTVEAGEEYPETAALRSEGRRQVLMQRSSNMSAKVSTVLRYRKMLSKKMYIGI